MKKVMIIGSGGSGKSTLAKTLGECLNIPVYHLDALFWKPNWEAVSKEQQINIQKQLVQQDKWLIDGNYGGTVDIRLEAADTVIFLDLPRLLCIRNIFKRVWMYRGKTRPDMGEDCPEKLDFAFLKWVWNFPKNKRPELLQKLSAYETVKNVIVLKSPTEIRKILDQISL